MMIPKQDLDAALARLAEAIPQNLRAGEAPAAPAIENSRRHSGALPDHRAARTERGPWAWG
jgi:hypothetical protein